MPSKYQRSDLSPSCFVHDIPHACANRIPDDFCRKYYRFIYLIIVISVSWSIRKSKDYVYGIWVYKALDLWKGYYRVKKSSVSYVKPWTEARNNKYMKYHSKLTYQLSFWNVSRKVDYHAGGKWFIHISIELWNWRPITSFLLGIHGAQK